MVRALSVGYGRLIVLAVTALAGIVCVFGSSHVPALLLTPAGLWLLFGAPVSLWLGLCRRLVTGLDSALLVATGFALLTDFAVMLGLNYLPAVVGDRHPLTRIPIAAGLAMGNILIGAVSPRSDPYQVRSVFQWRARPGLTPVVAMGVLCLLLAVAGPTRLNNGLGAEVSVVGYVAVAALLTLLLVKRDSYCIGAIETGIYFAGTALLLLTSLRGWLLTGHDIQTEYGFFRIDDASQHWEIARYPAAYHACLSITVLPLALVHLTAISGVGVFKIVLPLLFALAPVSLFRAVRNRASSVVAIVSAFFFLTFPTFYTDMPYLGRQEVAFVLLGSAVVVASDPRGSTLAKRRAAFLLLLIGVVLAHYSTAYILLVVLGGAAAFGWVQPLFGRYGRSPRAVSRNRSFLALWIVVAAAGFALLWAGPVTHTGGQLASTLATSIKEVTGGAKDASSSDTSGSLIGGAQISDAQRLVAFRSESMAATADARSQGAFLPASLIDGYPTPLVAQSPAPLTAFGRLLTSVGIPVGSVNSLLRAGIAAGLQLLIVLGLAVTLAARRPERRSFIPTRDQVALAAGGLGMLTLLIVVPQLSVDYGVLRAFQQGIFFYAPFMAAGLLWVLRWRGSLRIPLLCAVTAGLLLDLTGVIPQTTGGYPAQLALNNSGRYYDLYYPTAAEEDAARWLQEKMAGRSAHAVETSVYTFNEIQSIYTGRAVRSVFPTLLAPDDYVLLGPSIVAKGEDTVNYRGSLVTYRYPMGLLDAVKDRVYSGPKVQVYR